MSSTATVSKCIYVRLDKNSPSCVGIFCGEPLGNEVVEQAEAVHITSTSKAKLATMGVCDSKSTDASYRDRAQYIGKYLIGHCVSKGAVICVISLGPDWMAPCRPTGFVHISILLLWRPMVNCTHQTNHGFNELTKELPSWAMKIHPTTPLFKVPAQKAKSADRPRFSFGAKSPLSSPPAPTRPCCIWLPRSAGCRP